MSEQRLSEALAAFVASPVEIPGALVALADGAIVEVVRRALDGKDSLETSALSALVSRHSAGTCAVFGSPAVLGAPHAAMINACAAVAGGAVGADAVVVSSAIAVGQLVNADLERVSRGVAIGLEVTTRVARALGPTHVARGYDLAGTAARLGASAASSVVHGASPELVLASFAYGATTAAGLSSAPYASLTAGLAARDGVESVLFASAGLIGPPEPLEGRRGLLALESTDARPSLLVEGLGAEFVAVPVGATRKTARWSATTLSELLEQLSA
jgi:2-methylcitrate dehydratase PrpD